MLIEIISVPVIGTVLEVEEKNKKLRDFLGSHKILKIEKELVKFKNNAFWTYHIEYLPLEPKKVVRKEKETIKLIPKNELNEEQMKIYEKFRSIRTQLAAKFKTESYNIFINNDLIQMAKITPLTQDKIVNIKNINQHKAELYGKYFITTSSSK